MIHIYLCDDSQSSLEAYSGLIGDIARKHHIEISLHTFPSGEALLFHLSECPHKADIIYLDILMEATNGIETAKQLRKLGCNAEIIFLTTSEDFVFEAFDIAPVHYLRKESTPRDKFEQVFMRALSLTEKKVAEMFFFESFGVKKCLPVKSISYFEVWKRVLTVHTANGEAMKFYGKMEQVEKQMADKSFLRIHRSFLVNITYIASFMSQKVELKTGESLPIGVTYTQSARKAFSDYLASSHLYML